MVKEAWEEGLAETQPRGRPLSGTGQEESSKASPTVRGPSVTVSARQQGQDCTHYLVCLPLGPQPGQCSPKELDCYNIKDLSRPHIYSFFKLTDYHGHIFMSDCVHMCVDQCMLACLRREQKRPGNIA